MPVTLGDLAVRARDALGVLAATADPVEDEWQYVADLRLVWSARIDAVVGSQAGVLADDDQVEAIAALERAAAAIVDPHRAIDWLSTLPQVAILALDPSGQASASAAPPASPAPPGSAPPSGPTE